MKNKIITKRKFKEFGEEDFSAIDDSGIEDIGVDYQGADVDYIQKYIYKSLVKRHISGQRAEILTGTIIAIIEKMVEFRFNSKAMMIMDKAVEFINKRLG
jgi:hypothetical protein